MDTTFDGDGTIESFIPPHAIGPGEFTMAPNGDVFTKTGYYENQGADVYMQVDGYHRDGSFFLGPDPQPSAFQSGGRSLAISNGNRILRYNADYSASDTTFNQNGLNLGTDDHIARLTVLPNDQILVSGTKPKPGGRSKLPLQPVLVWNVAGGKNNWFAASHK